MVFGRQDYSDPTAWWVQKWQKSPIICLNNLYKWYTSCLLAQANQHIETYGLIQREQRDARGNCSGTVDNLIIDRMVCEDAQIGKPHLSMACIDVAKAYYSVYHGCLSEMFTLHRFPIWFAKVMEKLQSRTKKVGTLKPNAFFSLSVSLNKNNWINKSRTSTFHTKIKIPVFSAVWYTQDNLFKFGAWWHSFSV